MEFRSKLSESDTFEDSQDLSVVNDSQYEIVPIGVSLPDTEETQIWDEFPDQREVSLFTCVKAGKVNGAESTPFILPIRWTFATLKKCVEDFLCRNKESKTFQITQLYYKRAKGKGVVKMDGDGDIPALLKEYPLNYPCGKRRGKVLMYLAADVQEIKLKDTPQKSRLSQNALRRSPRLSKKMDVFLYAVGIDGKVSSSSEIIHNVSTTTTLKELTNLILEHSRDDTIYAPTKGIWWMRKGSKQLVSMKTEEDFHAGAQEYNETNVRIACVTIDAGPSSSVGSQSRKRKLDMSQGTTNPENDTWNTIHLTLIRDLESKGIKHRYSIKHLKLWTDLIVGGRLSGIGEEPNWTDHLEEVIVPPKSRRSSCTSPCSSIASSASSAASDGLQGGLLQMMMMNQQRSEMLHNTFMTTMLAMMQSKVTGMNPPNSSFTCNDSGNTSMPSRPATAKPQKMDLRNFNQEECCNFLLSLGLGKYIPQFQENQMDGQLLSALVHPHFGKMMLESMTLDEEERDTLISAIKAALV